MPFNPFSAISRVLGSPGVRRALPFAGAAVGGATIPDAVGDMKQNYDDSIRDETAREILGGLMDAQDQEAADAAMQQALYMQGAADAADALGMGDYGDYGDYLGSPDGMYSLAAAMTPKMDAAPKGPAATAGLKAPTPTAKAAPPSVLKLSSADALREVPYALAEAMGIAKEAVSPAAVGAGIGAGLGLSEGEGAERVRNALLGAVLGGAGGHIVSNPEVRQRVAGLGKTWVK